MGVEDIPKDKYLLMMWFFLLQGFGVLLPWSVFVNAFAYFGNYKFDEKYIGRKLSYTYMVKYLVVLFSQLPNLLMSWLNIFVKIKGPLSLRILGSLIIEFAIFLVTVIFCIVDTSSFPDIFLAITMTLIFVLNFFNSIYRSSVYGIAAKFPFRYIGFIILGNNMCAFIIALIDLFCKLSTKNLKLSALFYFSIAVLFVSISFQSFLAVPVNRFYSFYEQRDEFLQKSKQTAAQGNIMYSHILKKGWPMFVNGFFSFFVTLGMYPSVLIDIKPTTEGYLSEFFTPLMVMVPFNFFAMVGSLVATFIVQWPRPNKLWILIFVRFAFWPFYLLCNYQIKDKSRLNGLGVANNCDTLFFVANCFYGLTNGWTASLTVMYAPRQVEPEYASKCGMICSGFIMTGLISGILVSMCWPVTLFVSN